MPRLDDLIRKASVGGQTLLVVVLCLAASLALPVALLTVGFHTL